MLSPAERMRIQAEIAKLEKALRECRDEGIKAQIISWIEEEKEKLAEGKKKGS